MKTLTWNLLATATGLVAAGLMRKLVSAAWPGSIEPPVNPADRRAGWSQALLWATLSGVGAGVARAVSRRAAAKGWSAVLGESPPGVAANQPVAAST